MAQPGELLDVLQDAEIRDALTLGPLVSIIDVAKFLTLRRVLGEFYPAQVRRADVVLLNKIDLASEQLLGDLAFHGVAMVEFRRTPDGRAALMEVNPRLWGSLQLAIDASTIDFERRMYYFSGDASKLP